MESSLSDNLIGILITHSPPASTLWPRLDLLVLVIQKYIFISAIILGIFIDIILVLDRNRQKWVILKCQFYS